MEIQFAAGSTTNQHQEQKAAKKAEKSLKVINVILMIKFDIKVYIVTRFYNFI